MKKTFKQNNLHNYSVFVDGNEVNDYYLNKTQAENLKQEYIDDWYEEVEILNLKEN